MAPSPVAVYGLHVPVGVIVPANPDFPAAFRITMAAIDPTAAPEADADGNIPTVPRSVLRILKEPMDDIDEDDDELDEDYLQAILDGEDEDSDEEANGGPSDPKKQKAAQLIEALKKAEADSDEEMDDAKPKGKKSKGKAKATAEEEEEDSEEDSEDDMSEGSVSDLEQYLICTLDTERNYNQTLDIQVNENERVYFMVTGTHEVHLTGNFVIDDEDDEEDDEDDEYDEEDMYDLAGDELLGEDDEDEDEDELDDIDNPRVMEVDSEEEAPKLVATKKGKNKRSADEVEGLDELITKDDKSKKQAKKAKTKAEAAAAEDAKGDKKVQFAKNLEQGPTGSAAKAKQAGKGAVGVKVVQGVTVDDRKIGDGRVVKSGDTVGVRYIGKLENGKVFDANKKGKPFSFKAGKGQVIKGWDIGVQGMAIGGERRLTIPAHLAYGSKGLPGIPANSTLQFDIKLLEIK